MRRSYRECFDARTESSSAHLLLCGVLQVCLVVAKVASGRAEQHSEEKLALEGHQQLRRGPSRHHSRHLGHTSSPSSSLDTAVSLPRCAQEFFASLGWLSRGRRP